MRKNRSGRERMRWTEAEDATLCDLYPDSTPDALAEALSGSIYSSLITRAHLLGLGKSQKYLREVGRAS